MNRLAGKVAVITGAGSGIGRASARMWPMSARLWNRAGRPTTTESRTRTYWINVCVKARGPPP